MFEDFFHKNHEALLLVDRELKLVECNRAAGRFFELSRNKMLEAGTEALLNVEELLPLFDESDIVDGWVHGRMTRMIHGAIMTCDIRVLRLRPKTGGRLYAVEVSERSKEREAFELLRESVEAATRRADENHRLRSEAEFVNEKLASFAHRAAHDLRAPLSRIRQSLELIRGGRLGETANNELLELAGDSAERLLNMVNSLLSYSKASEQDVEKRPTTIGEILDTVRGDLNTEALGPHWLLINGSPVVQCDPVLMTIVFQNLLQNAIKYRHADRELEVIVSTQMMRTGGLALSIKDNGRGFTPEFSERIFVLFERAVSDVDGAGIGLATVRDIVSNHGWSIMAEGAAGKGANFTLLIPQDDVVSETSEECAAE